MVQNTTIPFELLGFAIDQVTSSQDLLTIHAHSTATSAVCPSCHRPSRRVHSHYTRSPRDMPIREYRVRLVLEVQRFRCGNEICQRQTFAERLPHLVPLYGQRTIGLTTKLRAIAFELSAEAGHRLTQALHMTISGDTLLRILCQTPLKGYPTPRVLGVDDWAMRKGHIYGSILVDLEQRQVVDLLPDREADTLAIWLKTHPGVEIICRDRASDYAKGAAMGAPHAIQIADRWHLLKNLGDALQRFLNGQTKALRRVAHQVQAIAPPSVSPPKPVAAPPPAPVSASQARRQRLFLEVKRLAAQGISKRAIARQLHLHRVTVDRYLEADELPHRQPPQRISKAVPYKSYILRRIVEEGCSIRQVWEELQAQGYTGTYASIQRAFRRWYSWDGRWTSFKHPIATPHPLSPRQAMWLLVRDPEQLTPDQQRSRELLCDLSSDIAAAYALAQRFVQMLQFHQVDSLDPWLEDARHHPVPALRRFAHSLQHDYAAVRAALLFDWSSGQVEGQVNRLKVIKRIMYGRAKLDLLRLRVLHPP